MKKAISVLLVALTVFCLTACIGTSKVETELKKGVWTREFTALGVDCSQTYSFKDDGKVEIAALIGSSSSSETGVYTVEENKIVVTYDSGETFDIDYIYEDGNLELIIRSDSGDTWELVHNN